MQVYIYMSVCCMVKGTPLLKPSVWFLFWTESQHWPAKVRVCSLHHSPGSNIHRKHFQDKGQFPALQRNHRHLEIVGIPDSRIWFHLPSNTQIPGDALTCMLLNKVPHDFLCPLLNYTHRKSHCTRGRQPAVCVWESPPYQVRCLHFRYKIPTLSGISKGRETMKNIGGAGLWGTAVYQLVHQRLSGPKQLVSSYLPIKRFEKQRLTEGLFL